MPDRQPASSAGRTCDAVEIHFDSWREYETRNPESACVRTVSGSCGCRSGLRANEASSTPRYPWRQGGLHLWWRSLAGSTSGGTAWRLTAHPGQELFARFSPDGHWIAFTGQYDGDEQVYVVPTAGGTPRQLTFYPASGPLATAVGIRQPGLRLVAGWLGGALPLRALRLRPDGHPALSGASGRWIGQAPAHARVGYR